MQSQKKKRNVAVKHEGRPQRGMMYSLKAKGCLLVHIKTNQIVKTEG